ncbi:hypothetical protein BKA64DRAFT_184602 [Cadophora sp. MPI-SDFR-AT-0126]|nr:hypothetical protein BKA64DRAFT_184602 [Leotiomycetes sp. MPI-SDFR-AT-0126]
MDIFNTDMRFEMEDIPPYSYPQTSLEPSSPDTTHNDYNRPVIQLQDIPALDERINGSMEFIWAEPHAILPPETSLQCPAIVNGVGIPPDQATAHNFSSCDDFSRNHNAVPTLDQPSNQRPTTPFVTRKRAPKAPTMHAKDWEPHKDRIKRLYVSEHKSIEELREIMNTELGISATLRQYKVQIQQMKIERNVKLKERKAVVKHIQHRAQTMGKKTGLTRIRGHEIDQEKLLRWAKENHTHQPFIITKLH